MYLTIRERIDREYRLFRKNSRSFHAATTILEKAIKKLIVGTVDDSSSTLEERASVLIGLMRPQAFVSALNLDRIRTATTLIESLEDEAEKNYLRNSLLTACQDLVVKYDAEIVGEESDERFLESSNDNSSPNDENLASAETIFESELSYVFNSIPRKWQDGAHIESRANYLTQRLCYANIIEDFEKRAGEDNKYDLTLSREEIRNLIEGIEDARVHDRALSDYYFVDAFVRQRRDYFSEDDVVPEKEYEISTDVDAEPDTIEGVFYRYDGVFHFIKENSWNWFVDYDEYEGSRYVIEQRFAELFKKVVGKLVRDFRNGELDEDEAAELKNVLSEYVPNLLTTEEYVDLLYDGEAQDFESRLNAVALEFNAFNLAVEGARVRCLHNVNGQSCVADSEYNGYKNALSVAQTLAARANEPNENARRLLAVGKLQFNLGENADFKDAKTTVRELLSLIPAIPSLISRLNIYRDLVCLHLFPKIYYGDSQDGFRREIQLDDSDGKMTRAAKNIAKLFVKEALKPDVSEIERDFYLGSLRNVAFLSLLKTTLGADALVEELLDACETEYAARRIRLLMKLNNVDSQPRDVDDALAQEALELLELTDPLGAVALVNDIYDALID